MSKFIRTEVTDNNTILVEMDQRTALSLYWIYLDGVSWSQPLANDLWDAICEIDRREGVSV